MKVNNCITWLLAGQFLKFLHAKKKIRVKFIKDKHRKWDSKQREYSFPHN